MNNMIKSTFISTGILFLSGCSNCATNPNQLSRLCAAKYYTVGDDEMDHHLGSLRAETDMLQQQVISSNNNLELSKLQLEQAEKKLSSTRLRTKSSRDKAQKIRAELQLKKRDIANKKQQLSDLENQIQKMKNSRASKRQQEAQLKQAQRELSKTKKEIKVLNDYLRNDLLIRAENSAKYD